MRGARNYLGDKLIRVASPHRILDPKMGPLIAVRLNIVSRKTLGGLQTDLSGRVLDATGSPVPGLIRSWRGFRVWRRRNSRLSLVGRNICWRLLFTGRQAGRAIAKELS